MLLNTRLKTVLGEVFDSLREGVRQTVPHEEYEKMKADFIFHMTDWQEDLEELYRLFSEPNEHSTDEASIFLVGFLYHVIPHLSTAGKLLLDDIPNPFDDEDDGGSAPPA